MQYTVRQTTNEEYAAKVPYLTSSMVEAVNTCPRWGVIHNVLGKRFVSDYRQMALEAGSLMHDVFAGLNVLQVMLKQKLSDHASVVMLSLFGKERATFIMKELHSKGDPSLDNTNALERFVFAIISTSDFYDDPNDRNRTLSNLETVALELLQYWRMSLVELPIYIEDRKDPTSRVGIEISLDGVFELNDPATGKRTSLRCIGLADAVYQNPETKAIALGEYKTGASLNDAWRLAFDTRHQITLYNALLQAYFGEQEMFKTLLTGSAIPVRTTAAPVQHFEVMRDQQNIAEMLRTFLFTRDVIDKYREDPLASPMFTHSCNRYFRPCSQLDLCTAAKDDQVMMLDAMTFKQTLSPSEEKAALRNM